MSVLLSVVLWTLGIALGLVLLVVLLALFVPVHLQIAGAVDEDRLEGRALVRWGWWVLVARADSATGIDLRVFGLRVWRFSGRRDGRSTSDDNRRERPQRKKHRRSRRGGVRTGWLHRRGLLRLLRAVLGSVKVEGELFGELGTSDPARTAALFGVVDGFASVVHSRSEHVTIDIVANWIDEAFALEGDLTVRLWLAQTLGSALWLFIRDAQVRRGVLAMARG